MRYFSKFHEYYSSSVNCSVNDTLHRGKTCHQLFSLTASEGADCLKQDAVSKASLIGTVFKFTSDFENSFAFNPLPFNTGSAEEGFKNHLK